MFKIFFFKLMSRSALLERIGPEWSAEWSDEVAAGAERGVERNVPEREWSGIQPLRILTKNDKISFTISTHGVRDSPIFNLSDCHRPTSTLLASKAVKDNTRSVSNSRFHCIAARC